MKVLGVLVGRRRERLLGGATAQLGSNIMENVRFGRLGALPWTLATYAPLPAPPPGPFHPGPGGPKMRAGDLLARPTGPNRLVLREASGAVYSKGFINCSPP